MQRLFIIRITSRCINLIRIKKSNLALFLLLLVLIFPFFLFGITGLRTFLGFFSVLILPAYLVLKNVDISEDERVFFSFFLGLIIVPLLVWYVDRILVSLRLSLILTSLLLYLSGLAVIPLLLSGKKKK